MAILTIQPTAKDSFGAGLVDGGTDYRTFNFGGSTTFKVTNYGGIGTSGNLCRAFLEFSLSGFPSGATLNTATLSLYYCAGGPVNPSGLTVWAYKLTRTNWAEGTGIFWAGNTSDCCYLRYSGTVGSPNNWTTAGGDYVTSSPSGGSTTYPASANAWMNWTVTDIVQNALTNSNPAEFLLRMANEGITTYVASSYTDFYSNNYAVDTTKCPKLVIDYSPLVGHGFINFQDPGIV